KPTGTRCSMGIASRPCPASRRPPDHTCMRLLYLAAVYLAAPVISAMLAARGLRDRSYWRNFGSRFAVSPIWVHAVSVGEVQAAAALVTALRDRYPQTPVLVTTFTPTGAA